MVKQERSRLTIDILGISELRWMGMGKFNSDDHYIYYSGQESLRRNGVTLIVNIRVLNAVLGCNLRNITMISVYFQGKPSSITVIQVYAPTSNAKETEVDWFYTTLMAESEEELKSLLMKEKEESEKDGLKLNIQKTKIMASGPITSWEMDGETVETVSDFIFWAPKSLQMVTAAMKLKGVCSLEEKL